MQTSDSAHGRQMGDEAVILQLHSGDYFSLDGVAAYIWEKITQGPIAYTDVLSALLVEYEGDADEITRDLADFCGTLLSEDLIELV